MQIEKYRTESTVDSLIHTFESVGERVIKKKVIYSKFEDLNNIGFPITILNAQRFAIYPLED